MTQLASPGAGLLCSKTILGGELKQVTMLIATMTCKVMSGATTGLTCCACKRLQIVLSQTLQLLHDHAQTQAGNVDATA